MNSMKQTVVLEDSGVAVGNMINGWGIDERTRYGTIIRQRIIEFDDRNVVDYV